MMQHVAQDKDAKPEFIYIDTKTLKLAISDIKKVTPYDGPWTGNDFHDDGAELNVSVIDNAIATVLNAVVSGQLVTDENIAPNLDTDVIRLREGLERIVEWAEAYPIDVFPEPNFKEVADVLSKANMSLDSVSASNMRHVVERVANIARAALNETQRDK